MKSCIPRTILLLLSMLTWLSSRQAYAQTPNGNKRIDSLNKALLTARGDTTRVKILIALSKMTSCSDSTQKMIYAREALKIATDINWDRGIVNADNEIGGTYSFCLKNYPKAIENYQIALKRATQYEDKILQATCLSEIANAYVNSGQNIIALDYYKRSLEIENRSEYQISTLGNMGVIYEDLGDYTHALENYQNSLKVFDRCLASDKNCDKNDSLTLGMLKIKIGEIFMVMSQYDKALESFEDALGMNKSLQNESIEEIALGNLGGVNVIKNDYGKALLYYKKGLGYAKKIKDKVVEAEMLDRIANIYVETDSLFEALELAKNSLEILESVIKKDELSTQSMQLSSDYITLGKIYKHLKDYPKSVNYLQDAIKICKKIGSLNDEKDAWKELSDTYEKMGQAQKSLEAYKNYINARDSVYNLDKAKGITRMLMQSEFDRKQAADSIKQSAEKKVFGYEMQKQRLFTYGGFAGLVLVLLLSFFIFRSYKQEKNTNVIISRHSEQISMEKEKSDSLLLNILPLEVANELKEKGNVHAKSYDNVTVMFTDFVNFTSAGERMSAQQLVDELDACFVAFDGIIEKYNIEKIKTVGDAYLAVSGLPHPNPTHAIEIVKAAIEINNFVTNRRKEKGDNTFEVRIGIHSGSVIAGIVGVKKFAYDIWGDTVNTAARMEQKSEAGKINITQTTYELLQDRFICNYRGEIEAKNKGKLKMYFVDGELI